MGYIYRRLSGSGCPTVVYARSRVFFVGRESQDGSEDHDMFFMMGLTEGRRDLEYDKMVICGICGRYGRYTVFMTYTVLLLFLIPIFKWNRRYFIRMSCCDTVYSLNPEKGRRIERGEDVEIEDSDMSIINRGTGQRVRICPSCGYQAQEDFEYCPKCGQRLG